MLALTFILAAAPLTFDVDPAQTELLAVTSPGGLPGASHPHVIVATQVKGTVVYDPEDASHCSVQLSFPTAGLRNDDPALRRREGMGDMSQGSREAVRENMLSEDQLYPKLFPTVSFVSTSVRDLGHGQLEVKGKISIRGVEKDVSLPVTVSLKDGVLTGTGALAIKHSDFKFKAYSAALGVVKNLDDIALKLKLVARPSPAVAPRAAVADAGPVAP